MQFDEQTSLLSYFMDLKNNKIRYRPEAAEANPRINVAKTQSWTFIVGIQTSE